MRLKRIFVRIKKLPSLMMLVALVSACGSSTSEKVDAGQRKYCDAYCADAGFSSPDVKTGDAIIADATVGDLGGTTDMIIADATVGDLGDTTGIIIATDSAPRLDTSIPDVPLTSDTSPTVILPADTQRVAPDAGPPDTAQDTQPISDTQVSQPLDTQPDRVEAASPDTTPDNRPDVTTDSSPGNDSGEAGTDTVVLPVDAPNDTPMDTAPVMVSACPAGQWAKQLAPPATSNEPSQNNPTQLVGLSSGPDGTRWMTGNIFFTTPVDYFGTGTSIASTGDGSDVFLAKVDPATGNATAAWAFGDAYNKNQVATQVAVAGNGQVGMIGNFEGEIDFTAKNSESEIGTAGFDYLANSAAIDFWALFSSTGTPVISHKVDVNGMVGGRLRSIGANTTPGQDSFAICGNTKKLVPNSTSGNGLLKIPTGAGYINVYGGAGANPGVVQSDIVVAKIDATGAVVWGRQIGGVGDQKCASVTIDNNGDVVLTGTYNGTLNFGGATAAFPDVTVAFTNDVLYVAKLAGATGDAIAAQAWGTEGIQVPVSITVDKDNNIILAGAISTNINFGGGTIITNRGLTDAFVVKFTPALGITWAKSYGDAVNEQQAYSVATSSNGDVYVTGLFVGKMGDLGLTSFGTTSTTDAFFARLAGSDGRTLCSSRFGEATSGQEGDIITVARLGTGNLLDSVIIGGIFSASIDFGSGTTLNTSFPGIARSFITRLAP